VSKFYQNALSEQSGSEAKDYLQEKMRSAMWMIRSIHQRQSTIQRVTESIMRFQRPFLDGGIEKLKPLVLRDVAEDVGLHESTVSRVTTNKYCHTPQGIYELKFFFNSRIQAQGGDDMASEAVKHAIARLVEKEQPTAPLSDQEIAEILQGEWDRGRMLSRLNCTEHQLEALYPTQTMTIARRTVAKYREAIHIPSSSHRRKVY
jgi:RNA polymerase sigma-54 factor